MVQYRTFHNCDPPLIWELWHAGNFGPCAAEGFPCDVLELFVFSQPFFDRNGFFIAEEDDRIAGFVHAGFGATADGSRLDRTQGVICAIAVHPDFRRRGIGHELLRRAEKYLEESGAETVSVGGGLNNNGFYNGIYGGLQSSGFSGAVTPWAKFLSKLGYNDVSTINVLHRDLTMGRDPVSARLIRHRRRLNLNITDRVADLPWWWHVRFGHLDALRFQLCGRHDDVMVASGHIVGLDVYVPKWGVRAVGIRDALVPEECRREGYGLSLILEICRRLREQSIQLVEAQIDEQNSAAGQLFEAAGFQKAQELLCFRRSLKN